MAVLNENCATMPPLPSPGSDGRGGQGVRAGSMGEGARDEGARERGVGLQARCSGCGRQPAISGHIAKNPGRHVPSTPTHVRSYPLMSPQRPHQPTTSPLRRIPLSLCAEPGGEPPPRWWEHGVMD
jgi:hypothetical protein